MPEVMRIRDARSEAIAAAHRELLGREPRAEEISRLLGGLETGGTPDEIRAGLAASLEAQVARELRERAIRDCHRELLGRPCTAQELSARVGEIVAGKTFERIRPEIEARDEARRYRERAQDPTADP